MKKAFLNKKSRVVQKKNSLVTVVIATLTCLSSLIWSVSSPAEDYLLEINHASIFNLFEDSGETVSLQIHKRGENNPQLIEIPADTQCQLWNYDIILKKIGEVATPQADQNYYTNKAIPIKLEVSNDTFESLAGITSIQLPPMPQTVTPGNEVPASVNPNTNNSVVNRTIHLYCDNNTGEEQIYLSLELDSKLIVSRSALLEVYSLEPGQEPSETSEDQIVLTGLGEENIFTFPIDAPFKFSFQVNPDLFPEDFDSTPEPPPPPPPAPPGDDDDLPPGADDDDDDVPPGTDNDGPNDQNDSENTSISQDQWQLGGEGLLSCSLKDTKTRSNSLQSWLGLGLWLLLGVAIANGKKLKA